MRFATPSWNSLPFAAQRLARDGEVPFIRQASQTTTCMLFRQSFIAVALLLLCAQLFAKEKFSPEVALVAKLYRDFAWEAVVDEPLGIAQTFTEQPASVLAKYLDGELVSLLIADRSCASKTGQICRLDFTPLWASQAPGATELKIRATGNPRLVSVRFKYPNTGEQIELQFEITQTSAGPRVHDIKYKGRASLREVLRGKP